MKAIAVLGPLLALALAAPARAATDIPVAQATAAPVARVATVTPVAPETVKGLVRRIEPAGDTVWAASSNGVFRVEGGGRFAKRFSTADGLPSNNVFSVSVYKGKVYAGTDAGLAVMEEGRWKAVDRILDVHLMRFVFTAVNHATDQLYVSSVYVSGGLLSFDGQDWKFRGGGGYGLFNTVSSFGFSEKETWLGTRVGVIYRMTEKGVDYFKAADGFRGNRVLDIAGAGGKMFVATDAGLAVFGNGTWKTVDLPAGGAVNAVAVSDDVVLAGGATGLVRIEGRRKEVVEDPSGKTKGGIFALAFVDGSLYAGTRDGLVAITGWQ